MQGLGLRASGLGFGYRPEGIGTMLRRSAHGWFMTIAQTQGGVMLL